jgi:hypothetical protein
MIMNQIIKTFVCASAVTEFALVAIDSAGKIAVATDPTANTIVGVAQRAGDAGDVVDVVIAGETRVIAGGSITITSSTVLAVTTAGAVQAAASSHYPVGFSLPNINQTSVALNEQFSILFSRGLAPLA